MFGIHRNFPVGGTDTSDATAEQWEIKLGKDAYIASGKVTGTGYFPAMMTFNGTTGYYSKTGITTAGNKFTVIARIVYAGATGGGSNIIANCVGPAATRWSLLVADNDHATTAIRGQAFVNVHNSSNTVITRIYSESRVDDGEPHTIMFSYDGDAGTAQMVVDGVVESNTSAPAYIAPAAATLSAGASSASGIGATDAGASFIGASIGFIGYRDAYLTNWGDFMQTDGTPKDIDASGWTEWGAQPLFWHESGLMTENKGSAGAMTANGTITLADPSTWS